MTAADRISAWLAANDRPVCEACRGIPRPNEELARDLRTLIAQANALEWAAPQASALIELGE